MAIWFTSDLHLQHSNIIKYCNRPFANVDEMNRALIRRWNNCISPYDTVIVTGDLIFYRNNLLQTRTLLQQLNRKLLILVRGNHDPKPSICYKLGIDFVCERLTLMIAGEPVLIAHYPKQAPWWKFWVRRHPKSPRNTGQYIIHGHTHTKNPQLYHQSYNIGVDAHHYQPVSMTQIEAWIQQQKQALKK